MTTLVLVRHGQASFGTQDYDRLSETGVRQSQLLGRHWAALAQGWDAAYCGSMSRQQDTARHALEVLTSSPGPETFPAFNEYDADSLIRAYLPVVARKHPEISLDRRELFKDRRGFQRFYEKIIECWLAGDAADGTHESWKAFNQRCLEGLRSVVTPGAKQHKVVFTSGGVITVALQAALGVDDATAFRLNWRIYNGGQHVFRWGRSGLQLLGFNDVSHLKLAGDAGLLTFR